MTTHEMLLLLLFHLCRVSGDAFLCVWFWVLPPLQLLESCITPHLQPEACPSIPRHSKFFLGPLVLVCH